MFAGARRVAFAAVPPASGWVRATAAGLIVAATVAGTAGAVVIARGGTREQTATIAVATIVAGYAFVLAGAYALVRRAEKRTGALMALAGFLLLATSMEQANRALPFTLGNAVAALPIAVIAHLVLAFPDGRLHSRSERLVVALVYVDATVLQITMLTFMSFERVQGCPCPRNLLLVKDDANVHMWVMNSQQWFSTLLTIWILALVVRRWWRGSRPLRRAITPIAAAGGLCAVLLGLTLIDGAMPSDLRVAVSSASRIALATIPAAYFLGLVRAQLDRSSVGELMVELERNAAPGRLRDALARALGDKSLQLVYWMPDTGSYVDVRGQPCTLPDGTDRATSLVSRDGHRVAALIHDPALSQNRQLLEEVTAAASLALDNERLQAELRAQLAEVTTLATELQASRARIVEAGDQARRKLERNLHDGAQQRIVTVAVALGRAEQLVRVDAEQAAQLIGAARDELSCALDELRELARGLHPAILNRGLRPALKSLVERSPVPVHLAAEIPDQLPITVVSTAYYVVAEALTNTARYSGAGTAHVDVAADDGWLHVAIHDDGAGGAALSTGSGLEGLRDRVDALGGAFELVSPAGAGTHLCVRLPING